MKFNSWYHYFWKVPLCGFLFFLGFIPGGQLATWMGLPPPALPAGADPATLARYTLVANLFLAAGLAVLALGISGRFISRWLILFFFLWIAYGINNSIEAAIFSTMSAASLYTMVLYLPAALLCSAAVAWLFPPHIRGVKFLDMAKNFFAGRSYGSWAWRILAAFLAFPFAYLFFGRLISPIVLPYYQSGAGSLALPGWNLLLPVLAVRSLLFLLVCLPVLIAWEFSNTRLFVALGLALFLFVGGVSMFYAIWLVPVLRITHTLEILADEMVYAAALILLLRGPITQPGIEKKPAQAQL